MSHKFVKNYKDKDFYTHVFSYYDSCLSREDLESMIDPIATCYISDRNMYELVKMTDLITKSYLGKSAEGIINFDEAWQSDMWWNVLEENLDAFDVVYYSDLSDDEYQKVIKLLES